MQDLTRNILNKLVKFAHSVIQVNNPFEENQVVGITNYIDFGFELATRYVMIEGQVLFSFDY